MKPMEDRQIAILKAKTTAERLQLAFNLFEFARRRITAELKFLHPQLKPLEINNLVSQRFIQRDTTANSGGYLLSTSNAGGTIELC
jgi:hypothetical protein